MGEPSVSPEPTKGVEEARTLMWGAIARLGVGYGTMDEFEHSVGRSDLPPSKRRPAIEQADTEQGG